MQAIRTKYFGPTNVKGSKVQAKCEAKTIYLSWDHSLNADQNHLIAARTLATQLGWNYGTWHSGWHNNECYWVCEDTRSHESFTVQSEAA